MFVDVRIFLQVLLKHVDRFLQILLLVLVLLLDLTVHLHLRHALRTEPILQLGSVSYELGLVLDELSGLVEGLFEGLDLVVLIRDSSALIGDPGLEFFLIVEEDGYKLCEGGV